VCIPQKRFPVPPASGKGVKLCRHRDVPRGSFRPCNSIHDNLRVRHSILRKKSIDIVCINSKLSQWLDFRPRVFTQCLLGVWLEGVKHRRELVTRLLWNLPQRQDG
jgi:hypothetical protein